MNRISEIDAELLRAFQKWQTKHLSQPDLQSAFNGWITAHRQSKTGAELSLSLGEFVLDESVADKRPRTVAQRTAALSQFKLVRSSFASALETLGETPQSSQRENVWRNCGTILSDDTFGEGRYAYYEPPVRSGEEEIWKAIDLKSADSPADATDPSRTRTVALKRPTRLDLEGENSEEAERRLLNEARRAARLEHSNICPVYDIFEGTSTQPPFYTMRFLGGQTLREVIQSFHSEKPVNTRPKEDWQTLIALLIDAAAGVAHAHRRGFAHLDIKPANVSIGDQGDALVLDWGMASRLLVPPSEHSLAVESEATDATSTRIAGTTYGTPAYAAPEQMLGNPCGVYTDVFQLGAMLFECLSGSPPFADSSLDVAILKSALNVRPSLSNETRLPHLQKNQLHDLVKVCEKAMETNPADRYPSADALRLDLQSWMNDLPLSIGHEKIGTKLARVYRKHRKSIWSSFIVNLALIASGLAVIWLMLSQIAAYRAKAYSAFRNNYHTAIRNAGNELSANRLEAATQALSVAQDAATTAAAFSADGAAPPKSREHQFLENLTAGYSEVDAEVLAENPHESQIVCLRSLLDGSVLSLSADGLLVWWDGDSRKPLRSLQLPITPAEVFLDQGFDEQDITLLYAHKQLRFEPGAPIAISADETNIAIAVERKNRLPEIQAFSLLTGEMVMRFSCSVETPRRTLKVHSLDFSPDGKRIAVGTTQKSWLLDYPSSKVISELLRKSETAPQRSFAFDKTGNRVLGLDAGTGLGYWNIDDLAKENANKWKAHDELILDRGLSNSLFFEERDPPILISPKNDQFLTFGPRGVFQYPIDVSLPSGDRSLANATLSTLSRAKTTCCAYSPNGMLIAAFDASRKNICVYSAITGVELRSHPCPGIESPTSVCFAEGNRSAWIAEDATVFRVDFSNYRAANRQETPLVTGPAIPCLKRQWSDDSMYGFSMFGTPTIWKYSEWKGQELLRNGASSVPAIQIVHISPRSDTFATCTRLLNNNKIEVDVFESLSGQSRPAIELPLAGDHARIVWTSDGKRIVAYQIGSPPLNSESTLEDFYIPDAFVLDAKSLGLEKLRRLPFLCIALLPDPTDGSMLAVGRNGILRIAADFSQLRLVASLAIPTNQTLVSVDYAPATKQLAMRIDVDGKIELVRRFDFGKMSFLSDIVLGRSSSGRYTNKISFDSSGDFLAAVLSDSDVAVIHLANDSKVTHQRFEADKSISSLIPRLKPGSWMVSRVPPITSAEKRDSLAGEIFELSADPKAKPSIVSTTLPLPRVADGALIDSSMIVGNLLAGAVSRLSQKDNGDWESVALTESRPFRSNREPATIDMAIDEKNRLAVLARIDGSIELCEFPSFASRGIWNHVFEQQEFNAMFRTQVAHSEVDSCIVVGAPNKFGTQIELKCLDLLGKQVGETTLLSATGSNWSLSEKGNFAGFATESKDAGVRCVVLDRRKNNQFTLGPREQNGPTTCVVVDERADVVAFGEVRRVEQGNVLTGYREIVHVFRLSTRAQLASLLVEQHILKKPISLDDPAFESKQNNFENPINKIAISPNGMTVAARRTDGGDLYLWDISKAEPDTMLAPSLELSHRRTAYNPWSPLGFNHTGDRLFEGVTRAVEVLDFRSNDR